MLTDMRSTFVIDDRLFRKIKRLAADLGITMSDVVNQALREFLEKAHPQAQPFQMITFGDRRNRVHHEPAEFTHALDREDEERATGRPPDENARR
jgi:antitoxin component of RelBE/YafQ-DinJ toxin-antitoxin module